MEGRGMTAAGRRHSAAVRARVWRPTKEMIDSDKPYPKPRRPRQSEWRVSTKAIAFQEKRKPATTRTESPTRLAIPTAALRRAFPLPPPQVAATTLLAPARASADQDDSHR